MIETKKSPCTCRLFLELTNRSGESARYKVVPLSEGDVRRPGEAVRAYQLTRWSLLDGRWQWAEQYVGWQSDAGQLGCTCPDVSYLKRKARRDEEAGDVQEEKEYQCKHVRALLACGLLWDTTAPIASATHPRSPSHASTLLHPAGPSRRVASSC